MQRIGELTEGIAGWLGAECVCRGNPEAAPGCPARARDIANLRWARPGEIAEYEPFCEYTRARLTPEKRAGFAIAEATRLMTEGGFPAEMAIGASEEGLDPAIREWRPPKNLFLAGKPGVGKTWACAALARRELAGNLRVSREYPAAFVYAPDISPFSRVRDLPWLGAWLLVLDDLPLHDPHRAGLWLSVIDFRYRNRLGLMATANTDTVNIRAVPQAWKPALSRLTDRGRSISLEMGGADRRKA